MDQILGVELAKAKEQQYEAQTKLDRAVDDLDKLKQRDDYQSLIDKIQTEKYRLDQAKQKISELTTTHGSWIGM